MTDERITAYLLEELTEEEAEQFEEQCFSQTEWPGVDLDSAEEDLIEAYVRNELTPDRKKRFEENYLITTAREERVLLARSFLRVVCTAKPTLSQRLKAFLNFQDLTLRFLVPRFAMLLVVFGLMGLIVWNLRPKTPQSFAYMNLTSVSEDRNTRSSNAPTEKITLPLDKDALQISLTLPEPTPEGATYSVQWENVKGSLGTLKIIDSKDSKSPTVIIPADRLSPGQYTLKVLRKDPNGAEHPINYFFDVE